VKRQKLEALLTEHGCIPVRDQGKHTVWKAPTGALATVPRHTEIKKFTARSICKGASRVPCAGLGLLENQPAHPGVWNGVRVSAKQMDGRREIIPEINAQGGAGLRRHSD